MLSGSPRARVALLAMIFGALASPTAAPAAVSRVSLTSDGRQATGWPYRGDSFNARISADGHFIVFQSSALDLVPGANRNSSAGYFVRNLVTGVTEEVTVPVAPGYGYGYNTPTISAQGRYVAFSWYGPNLVPGDTNNTSDAFVRDRETGTTERVSVASDGSQGSSDGGVPSISADGRFVAFSSFASNLVPGDTNRSVDAFVRDRALGTTQRIVGSLNGAPVTGGVFSMSADGRFVVFGNSKIFIFDRVTGTTEQADVSSSGSVANGSSSGGSLSADDRFVTFMSNATNLVPGDTNGFVDVFVRDRLTGTTERVDVSTGGGQTNSWSSSPSISGDGRFAIFTSFATNVVAGDTNDTIDVFVRDRLSGTTERISIGRTGGQGSIASVGPTISSDGRFVAFDSRSSNLVPADTNHVADVFVADRAEPSSFDAPTQYFSTVRAALVAKRAEIAGKQGRYWLDRALESLDVALEPRRWANGTVAVSDEGVGAMRALRTATLRLKYGDAELREATAQERVALVGIMGSIVRVRFNEVWEADAHSFVWPKLDFLLWRVERRLDSGDARRDKAEATIDYIEAWRMLLGLAP
jgi:hypothetical protein